MKWMNRESTEMTAVNTRKSRKNLATKNIIPLLPPNEITLALFFQEDEMKEKREKMAVLIPKKGSKSKKQRKNTHEKK